MIGHPKPHPREKVAAPLRRSGLRRVRKSPYLHPDWQKLSRQARKRSKGTCEVCRSAGVTDVHHTVYAAGSGWRRLIVDLATLVACCRDCHLYLEAEKKCNTTR